MIVQCEEMTERERMAVLIWRRVFLFSSLIRFKMTELGGTGRVRDEAMEVA